MSARTQPFWRSSRLWRRGWYHLAGLMLIVPAIYLKPYLDLQAALMGAPVRDQRSVPVTVGPWTFELQESGWEEPAYHPGEGFEKPFFIVPCASCVAQIRAIFINLKRPGSSEYGELFEGNPYRAQGGMEIRNNALPDDKVWLTVEGWDGSLHQATIPVGQASPVTERWLARRASR